MRSTSRLAGLLIPAVLISSIAATRVPLTEWTAKIAGKEGRKVTGSATVKPTADGKGIDVHVTLDGDTPGATRPWHIHTGTCANGIAVFGGPRAYTPIAIDAKGHGEAKVTVPAVPADTGSYNVNIHDSAAAMGIVVACGDLAKH
ncbi:hypothetical protein [Gemmatimonas aurantiaca]|uniref:hypothetical protein n=1 Tax=Gemmatimonas aurantiaca TaxID=173480 RepID=UPI00301E186D